MFQREPLNLWQLLLIDNKKNPLSLLNRVYKSQESEILEKKNIKVLIFIIFHLICHSFDTGVEIDWLQFNPFI